MKYDPDAFRAPDLLCRYGLPSADDYLILRTRGAIGVLLVGGKVRFGDGKLVLKQALVDRAEFAHAKTAEVDRTPSFVPLIEQKFRQDRTEIFVTEMHLGESCANLGNGCIGREQSTVVLRNTPFFVSQVNRIEQPIDFLPMRAA